MKYDVFKMNHQPAIAFCLLSLAALCGPAQPANADDCLEIGSRLELFVDHYLIEKMTGTRLELQRPQPAEIALQFDRPWEGLGSAFPNVVKFENTYHMYYRGMVWDDEKKQLHEWTCYARSADGISWEKPNLRLVEVMGTRENNALFDYSGFVPFLDTRPGVPSSERLKALKTPRRETPEEGYRIMASGDGINWREVSKKPSIEGGVISWSPAENCYVAHARTNLEYGLKIRQLGDEPTAFKSLLTRNGEFSLHPGDQTGDDAFRYSTDGGKTWKRTGLLRTLARATSHDLLEWSDLEPIQFSRHPPTPDEQFYTNPAQPYVRAPHLLISLAVRFLPGRQALSDEEGRSLKPDNMPFWSWRDCSDAVLLTSRGGNRYDRTFPQAFLRPGVGIENWGTRTNYPGLGIVATGDHELSFYVTRHYELPSGHVRRYTLRTDGFASLHADYDGGEMVTKPLSFEGKELVLNFSTSAAGSVRVEIQDGAGKPISGFGLSDCPEIIGDKIEHVVSWNEGSDVSRLEGQPVRLRFVMKDADVYSLRFR